MTGFLGADTEQLRAHAQLLITRAQSLSELRSQLEPLVMNEASWVGPDADAFRAAWSSGAATQMSTGAEKLRSWSGDLDGEAEEQDTTSQDDGAGGTGGTGDGGTGDGAPGGNGQGEATPSLGDRIKAAVEIYNKAQSLFSKGKKAWDLATLVRNATRALDDVTDPLVYLMGVGEYGKRTAASIFSSADEAWGKLAQKIAGKLDIPNGFGTKNFFGFVDDLAAKAPFLAKGAGFLGKALPVLDVGLGAWQAYEGFSSGDTFKGVTGTASAIGGTMMLVGGAMSATGIGAVAGAPIAAIGAGITTVAAVADLGKAVVDNWPEISATAADAWNGATSAVSSGVNAVSEAASNVGGAIADGVSGAWNSVFG